VTRHRDVPPQPEPGEPEETVRSVAPLALRTATVLVALAALIVVGCVALGTAHGRENREATPAGTVRAYLTDAVIDRNGVEACKFLTPAARQRLEDLTTPHPSCAIALSSARLRAGGQSVRQESALKELDYRGEEHGTRAWVSVGTGTARQTFGLRRATPGELREFTPPPTHWRIDSGVDGLLGGA
jgi:hypothetical protein